VVVLICRRQLIYTPVKSQIGGCSYDLGIGGSVFRLDRQSDLEGFRSDPGYRSI
jgi:hypothetical protein